MHVIITLLLNNRLEDAGHGVGVALLELLVHREVRWPRMKLRWPKHAHAFHLCAGYILHTLACIFRRLHVHASLFRLMHITSTHPPRDLFPAEREQEGDATTGRARLRSHVRDIYYDRLRYESFR